MFLITEPMSSLSRPMKLIPTLMPPISQHVHLIQTIPHRGVVEGMMDLQVQAVLSVRLS